MFDIVEFGAVGDGVVVNTGAIQGAVDACAAAGGGRVVCGAGVWVTGCVELKSGVELHLASGCRLVGSGDLADYSPMKADGFRWELGPEKSSHSVLRAVDAVGFAVTGLGTIDGNGLAFYEGVEGEGKLAKPETPRPRIGMFYKCRDFRLEGVTLVDSACWTLWLMQCEGVQVRGLSIGGNRRMRNVDGIDIDGCRGVTVSDCVIDTEDDCVVLRAMQPLYEVPVVCEQVTVTNCVLRSGCQGVRVGCPGDGVIRDCTLSNLVIESANNGIVFDNPHRYLPAGNPGSADVSGISFSNVVVRCGQVPIKLYVENGIVLSQLGHVSFSNMRLVSGKPVMVQGCAETVIRGVRFTDVVMETTAEQGFVTGFCEGLVMDGVSVTCGVTQPG